MIREFWAENFYSIKERQVLNFESKGARDAFSNSIIDEKTRINKLEILYGANASGKSNVLYALQTVFKLLIVPRHEKTEKVIGYRPFAMTNDQPVSLFVSFYANHVKYDYTITYSRQFILSETLFYYPNGSKSLFYKREFLSKDRAASIVFGQSLGITKKAEDVFISNTLNNHSVLSTVIKTSFEDSIDPLKMLHEWIVNHVHDINGDNKESISFTDTIKEVCENPKMKSFYLQMIKKADFNIVDFNYIETDRNISERVRKQIQQDPDLPEKVKQMILEGKAQDILFTSKVADNTFELKSSAQSSGTIEFMQRLRFLYDTISGEHIYFLDEPEEDLHYDLFLFYLNAFLYNSSESQIIMASHLTTLLSEELINENRDLVFFVEKDINSAASSYTRGDKFGLHKRLSLYNAYRIGRLGAKPELGSPFVLSD